MFENYICCYEMKLCIFIEIINFICVFFFKNWDIVIKYLVMNIGIFIYW